MYVVTTVSTRNVDMAKNLGADKVIDYSTSRFEDLVEPVDVVFDTRSYIYESRTLHSSVLKSDGWYLNVLSSPNTLQSKQQDWFHMFIPEIRPFQLLTRILREQWSRFACYVQSFHFPMVTQRRSPLHYHCVMVKPNGSDLKEFLTTMTANGMRGVVDRVFPMTIDKIKAAHEYVAAEKACGKVIIRMQPAAPDKKLSSSASPPSSPVLS
jgi:NADPH:quinone reductase-like Zn-dependent oxidoreductase